MSSVTENYGLYKPSGDDYYDVEDFNRNVDILDGVLRYLQGQININLDGLGDVENRSFGTNTIDIYVNSNSGNDENNGSEYAPLKTITKAVDLLYKLNGHQSVNIHIASGTYNENISVINVRQISFLGANQANVVINGKLLFDNVQRLNINNITVVSQNPTHNLIENNGGGFAYISNCNLNHNSYGVAVAGGNGIAYKARAGITFFINVSILNAKIGVNIQYGGIFHTDVGVFNTCNTLISLASGAKGSSYGGSRTSIDVYVSHIGGTIFQDNKYIDIKTANLVN